MFINTARLHIDVVRKIQAGQKSVLALQIDNLIYEKSLFCQTNFNETLTPA
ncbi:MAG: hypothetical protein FWF12_12150 [Betaproteobacteria bacterium]|nr:hypothetical protein [Betaproteobacteria bacterium]